jgi:multisubunit Na+/H+ antiporter MnhB subunit
MAAAAAGAAAASLYLPPISFYFFHLSLSYLANKNTASAKDAK